MAQPGLNLDHVSTVKLERLVFAGDRLKAITDLFDLKSQEWFFQRLITLQNQVGKGRSEAGSLNKCLEAVRGEGDDKAAGMTNEARQKTWRKIANKNPVVKTQMSNIKVLLLRQALSEFYQSGADERRDTISRVRKVLSPKLDHPRPAPGGKRPRAYPSVIATSKTQKLLKNKYDSMVTAKDNSLTKVFTSAAACSFLCNESMQDPELIAEFLDLLSKEAPETNYLLTFIKKDLVLNDTKFGERAIHQRLTCKQLQLLSGLKGNTGHTVLQQDEQYHKIYMGKLRENGEHTLINNLSERAKYMKTLVTYLKDYEGLENYAPSLVAIVLYNYLTTAERTQGVGSKVDKAALIRYLSIEKRTMYAAKPSGKKLVADHQYRVPSIPCLAPIGDDEPFVRRALQQLILAGSFKSPKLMDQAYYTELKCETNLVSGKSSPKTVARYNQVCGNSIAFEELQARTIIELMPSNQEVYAPADKVVINFRAKNVPALLVKIYELDAFEYYAQYKQELNADIGVDGMRPFLEMSKSYTEARIERVTRKLEIPELSGKRGVFLVDMTGNGQQARALIRKGELRYVSRQGINAANECVYNFRIFDESCKSIEKGSVWVDGAEYRTNPDNDNLVEVPFSGADQPNAPIILSDLTRAGSSTLHFFDRKTENFRMDCGLFIDRESLLCKATSTALIRPKLFLNDEPVTPQLILNAQLTFIFTTVNGDKISKTVILDGPGNEEGFTNTQENTVPFIVPMHLRTIELTLDAEVAQPSQGARQKLQNKRTFSVNEIDQTQYMADLFMLPRGADGYAIAALGKNGEALSDVVVKIGIKHRYFTNLLNYTLQTDESGLIQMGRLPDVDWVEAFTSDFRVFHDCRAHPPQGANKTHPDYQSIAAVPRKSSWTLLSDKVNTPQVQNVLARKSIKIPFMEMTSKGSDVYVYDKFFAKEVAKGKSSGGYITVNALPPGDYVVLIRDPYTRATVNLAVTDGTTVNLPGPTGPVDYVVSPNRIVELSEPLALQIVDIKGSINAGSYKVTVKGADADTRIHAISVNMVPRFNSYDFIKSPMLNPIIQDIRAVQTLYTEQSPVSDEYRYILNRKTAQKTKGLTCLTCPTLIQKGWSSTGEASLEAPVVRVVNNMAAAGTEYTMRFPRIASDDYAGGEARSDDSSNVEFLKNPSTLLYNCKPGKDGTVQIPIRGDMGYNLIQIIAVDDNNTSIRNVILPNPAQDSMEKKEVRLESSLDLKKHYTENRATRLMQAKDSYKIVDQRLFESESYDDITDVFQLFDAVSCEQPSSGVIYELQATLNTFGFINMWTSYDNDTKLGFFNDFACNELNFFIFQKDPDFFNATVRPFLQSKLYETFFDRFLLDRDLSSYTSVQKFQNLNAFEKILLASKVPEVKTRVLRQITDISTQNAPGLAASELNFDKVWMAKRLSSDNMDAYMIQRVNDNANFGVLDSSINDKPQIAAYIPNDLTQMQEETGYYKVPCSMATSKLIEPTLFWADYAQFALGKGSARAFLTENLIHAASNLSSMLIAMGCLSLPFRSDRGSIQLNKEKPPNYSATLQAEGPAIVLCKEVKETQLAEKLDTAIDTNYFDPMLPTAEGFVQGKKFVSGKVYGSRVVLTNAKEKPDDVFVLTQIPQGSIPVDYGFSTNAIQMKVGAFKTAVKKYYFYFPEAGSFTHYPPHVFRFGVVVGFQNQGISNLEVEDREAYERRTESTKWFSVTKTEKEITDFLKKTPGIYTINLDQIAWRAGESEKFFIDVTTVLRTREIYNEAIWAYSLKHYAAKEVTEYLRLSPKFNGVLKPHFDLSQLCSYNASISCDYQVKEFWPVRSARAHGGLPMVESMVTNADFQKQYRAFLLRALFSSYSRESLTVLDKMSAIYYMLCQDRITEALTLFSEINPKDAQSVSEFNYDYMKAYLAFYTGDTKEIQAATQLVAQYLERPLPPSKRKLWEDVQAQFDEILDQTVTTDFDNIDEVPPPALDVSLDAKNREIALTVTQLSQITVNFYKIDLELKFSIDAFGTLKQPSNNSYSFVTPNESLTKDVQAMSVSAAKVVLPIPDSVADMTCIIEAIGVPVGNDATITKALTFYDNQMDIQIATPQGELRVLNTKTNKPIARAYVKVYGRHNTTQKGVFYKDGYTDFRGRFDYRSISTDLLTDVNKLAMLVATESSGSTVVEVDLESWVDGVKVRDAYHM